MEPKPWLTIFEPDMGRRRSQRKAYLFPKGDYWYLQYRMDSRDLDPATGRPKRIRETRQIARRTGPEKKNKRQAQRIAWDTVLSKLDQAAMRPGSAMTLEEFVNRRWRPDRLEHLSAKGKQSYETQLRNHILPVLGSKPLRDIGLAHVQDLINQRAQWISPKTNRKLEPESLAQILATLKAIFNHAERMDCITTLPTKGVRLPKSRPKEKPSLTWEQVETISRALPEPLSTLVLFLAWTGLRIGEACGLRWRDLDLEKMIVHVRENFVMGRYQDLKTKKSSRSIPIQPELAQRLVALRATTGEPSMAAVFANATKRAPIDAHNVANRILKPLVKKLGLPWVSWHTFRHTNSTLAEEQGMTVSQRMLILGHSDPKTTRRYTHADVEGAREPLGKINRKPQKQADSGTPVTTEHQFGGAYKA